MIGAERASRHGSRVKPPQSPEEHAKTVIAANNYALSLHDLQRYAEAKLLLHTTIPVARRVLGASHQTTLTMRWNFAKALYRDDSATLDDLREAVTEHEEIEPIARRVFGGAHPDVVEIENSLQNARAALRARETPGDA